MDSVTAIFDELGGYRKAAQVLAVKPTAASEMKRRNSIPVRYWPRLVDACKEMGIRGVNYDVLVELHQKDDGK